MPHAIDRLLATPIISPRLPRIRPETSGMFFLSWPVNASRLLWHRVFWPSSKPRNRAFVVVISIHFREYDRGSGVLLAPTMLEPDRRIYGQGLPSLVARLKIEEGRIGHVSSER